MRIALISAAALTLAAIVPAAAQMAPPPPAPGPMMGGPMMGGPMMGGPSGQSCVSGGQFVPCPPMGMQAAMGNDPRMMGEPMPRKRMSKREMRMQKRMMQQNM